MTDHDRDNGNKSVGTATNGSGERHFKVSLIVIPKPEPLNVFEGEVVLEETSKVVVTSIANIVNGPIGDQNNGTLQAATVLSVKPEPIDEDIGASEADAGMNFGHIENTIDQVVDANRAPVTVPQTPDPPNVLAPDPSPTGETDTIFCEACQHGLKLSSKGKLRTSAAAKHVATRHVADKQFSCPHVGCSTKSVEYGAIVRHMVTSHMGTGSVNNHLNRDLIEKMRAAARICFPLHQEYFVAYYNKMEELLPSDGQTPAVATEIKKEEVDPVDCEHSMPERRSIVSEKSGRTSLSRRQSVGGVEVPDCQICHEVLKRKSGYQAVLHAKKHVHASMSRFKCSACSYQCASESGASEHLNSKHATDGLPADGGAQMIDQLDAVLLDAYLEKAVQCFPYLTDQIHKHIEIELQYFHVNGPKNVVSRGVKRRSLLGGLQEPKRRIQEDSGVIVKKMEVEDDDGFIDVCSGGDSVRASDANENLLRDEGLSVRASPETSRRKLDHARLTKIETNATVAAGDHDLHALVLTLRAEVSRNNEENGELKKSVDELRQEIGNLKSLLKERVAHDEDQSLLARVSHLESKNQEMVALFHELRKLRDKIKRHEELRDPEPEPQPASDA